MVGCVYRKESTTWTRATRGLRRAVSSSRTTGRTTCRAAPWCCPSRTAPSCCRPPTPPSLPRTWTSASARPPGQCSDSTGSICCRRGRICCPVCCNVNSATGPPTGYRTDRKPLPVSVNFATFVTFERTLKRVNLSDAWLDSDAVVWRVALKVDC